MRFSVVPIVEISIYSLIGFAYHPLQEEDRLGSDRIDFPIGYVFAEHDWNGSDGADILVKQNKHFKSGKSQIFTIANSTHDIHA